MRASLIIAQLTLLAICVSAGPITGKQRLRTLGETSRHQNRFLPIENKNGTIEIVDLLSGGITTYATVEDVSYYVYTRDTADNPTVVTNADINQLLASPFDPAKRVLVISHGWNNDHTSSVNVLITAAALAAEDINVIVVDWGGIANEGYLEAFSAVADIGAFVSAFLSDIQATYGLDGSRFILVGHSLGAHLIGRAGALLSSKAHHMIGLDPALPLYTYDDIDGRIDPTDANRVEVIHTCAGFLGYDLPLGHVDYYPNGGTDQPGCGTDLLGKCAHGRSYEYFSESIRNFGGFSSVACPDWDTYLAGSCSGNAVSQMGRLDIDFLASELYYLETNDASPYGRG